ncbi:MAG: T9SS type A sorting domain-containing protein [Bacteroidetes bacterium]|nr:T9SS type A sorting domain-containing protein [Bacteroidota bacterium]
MKKIFVLFSFSFIISFTKAQNDTVIFTQLGHFYYDTSLQWSAYTPLIDRMGRNYVYTASVDLGEVTFDVSNVMNPMPVCTLTVANLNNLKATYLAQVNNYLFIACGGFQGSTQRAGLSIYDVTNPLIPVLKDHWDSSAFTHGCAHVVVSGNYAYLGCMTDGVVILNISNVNNIQFVTRFQPSLISCSQANNSRGLFISHDTLLVTNDCGGLRVISVANPAAPVELGAYSNAAAYSPGMPAYNKVLRLGDHAYIPVDYCGFEIDNVANPSAIVNEGVWNPIPCNNFNWFGADVHANEIVSTLPTANVIMCSGGDSQVLAFDPTQTSPPRLMGEWGVPNDSLIAWGVDEYNGLVCAAYVRDVIQIFQPYYGKWGGIQLLNWTLVTGENENYFHTEELRIFPNPSSASCTIALPQTIDETFTIDVIDVMGRIVKTQTVNANVNGRNATIDLSDVCAGLYTIRVTGAHAMCAGRIVKAAD